MTMQLPDADVLRPPDEEPLDGWKEIAKALRCSEKHAARLASRNRSPLPVYCYGKRVYAWPSEVRLWQRLQTLPYQAAKVVEAVDERKARPKVSKGGNRRR